MRIWAAILAIGILTTWTGRAIAEDEWTEFQSAERGFAITFPGIPKTTGGNSEGANDQPAQYSFLVDLGDAAYAVAVFEYPAGTGPRPDTVYLTRAVNFYAQGSGAAVRTRYPVTIVGHPGIEAITDNPASNLSHLLDITVVDDRVYLIVSAGPRGHEASNAAIRFRDSFRFLGQ